MFNLNSASEPVGTLDVALGHAARLLERDAALDAEQASEILKAVPDHPRARLILGAAHRTGGHTQLALEILEPLAGEQPRSTPCIWNSPSREATPIRPYRTFRLPLI
jgi:hypothetical protein